MKGFLLFILALSLYILTFVIAFINNHESYNVSVPSYLLGIIPTIAFSFSVAGLIIGKNDRTKSKRFIGIIGNLIIVGLFLSMIVYIIIEKNEKTDQVSSESIKNKLNEAFHKIQPEIFFYVESDTILVTDSLRIHFWLSEADYLYEISEELNIKLNKFHCLYPDGIKNPYKELAKNIDTVNVNIGISNAENLPYDFYSNSVNIGINTVFEKGDIILDTTFVKEVRFVVFIAPKQI